MAGNRGVAYTNAEICFLLDIVRRLEPISGQQWEIVAEEHAVEYGDKNRTADSLKKKFRSLVNMKAPTGDPNIPEVVFLAKNIDRRIVARSEASTGSVNSAEHSSNSGREDEPPPADMPRLPDIPEVLPQVNAEAQQEGGGGVGDGGGDVGEGGGAQRVAGGAAAAAPAAAARGAVPAAAAAAARGSTGSHGYDTPVSCHGSRHKRYKTSDEDDTNNFAQMIQAMLVSREVEREDRQAQRDLERQEQKEQREQERKERQEQRDLEREERHRQFDLQMLQMQQQAQFQSMLLMHMFGKNDSGGGSKKDNDNDK